MKRLFGPLPMTALAALVAAASWSAATRDVRAPEPAVLSNNLGSPSGAAAVAIWSTTAQPTTGYRFPLTFTSVGCHATAQTGAPCSTNPQPAGSRLVGTVERRMNLCRCIQ